MGVRSPSTLPRHSMVGLIADKFGFKKLMSSSRNPMICLLIDAHSAALASSMFHPRTPVKAVIPQNTSGGGANSNV